MIERIGWKAASNGAQKRHWFVMHHEERLYYANRRKQLVWFGSCKAAQRKADQLNREHPEPTRQDGTVWFTPLAVKRKPHVSKTYRLRVGALSPARSHA
jgi:hypothetical protein